MTKKQKPHGSHAPPNLGRKGLHKNWKSWVVVGLMLAGMAAYILSMDEAWQPLPGDSQSDQPMDDGE